MPLFSKMSWPDSSAKGSCTLRKRRVSEKENKSRAIQSALLPKSRKRLPLGRRSISSAVLWANTRIPCAVTGAIGIALFCLGACLIPRIIYTGSISKPFTCLRLGLGLKGASSHVPAAFTSTCRCRYGEGAGQQTCTNHNSDSYFFHVSTS
jgi:hypothetical protein